jgi:carbamoylphosphate synthase large subunit
MLQLPAIQKAKALGYCVGVVDSDPDALGIRYADRYFCVSTIDTQRVVEAAVEFQADGIMTLATDMPVRSIAVACEALGLPGLSLDTAIKSTDKGEMMQAFKAHAVPHPWFIISSSIDQLDSMKDSIEYPCGSTIESRRENTHPLKFRTYTCMPEFLS